MKINKLLLILLIPLFFVGCVTPRISSLDGLIVKDDSGNYYRLNAYVISEMIATPITSGADLKAKLNPTTIVIDKDGNKYLLKAAGGISFFIYKLEDFEEF